MTITFQEFITKYDGKFVDGDGAYGSQCVDLFRAFCHEVLGIGQPQGVIGAKVKQLDALNQKVNDILLEKANHQLIMLLLLY